MARYDPRRDDRIMPQRTRCGLTYAQLLRRRELHDLDYHPWPENPEFRPQFDGFEGLTGAPWESQELEGPHQESQDL